MLDPGFGFGCVARADVDDVVEVWLAKKAGAGEGAYHGHILRLRNRHSHQRCRRPDRADQGEDFVFVDQPECLQDGAIWIVAVVAADQFEFPAVNAALGVDLGKSRQNALAHFQTQSRGGTGHRSRLAEQDSVPGNANLVGLRGAGEEQQPAQSLELHGFH